MKTRKEFCSSDVIIGKETEDYINEFSPHRLSMIRFQEDSSTIFEANEEKVLECSVMSK